MRHTQALLTIVLFISCLSYLSCTDSKTEKEPEIASYLTANIGKTNITRSGQPMTYVGQSLFEYINGGAEIYHAYHFVDVTTASYDKDGTEIMADIYRFENSDYAFGLYSSLRPEKRQTVALGVDGFFSETTIDFVVGKFVLKIYGYDKTADTKLAVNIIAAELEQSLPGTRSIPEIYGKLPVENRLTGSENMHAVSFLGIKGMDEVYSCRFAIEADTVELFILKDPDHALLSIMKAKAKSDQNSTDILTSLGLSEESSTVMIDPYYGNIVLSSNNSLLMGIIGYSDKLKLFFSASVSSLN